MNHLTHDKLSIVNQCIENCEKNIDSCQNVISMCSTRNFEECAEKLGIFVRISKENIKSCHACINMCKDHLKDCDSEKCQVLCKELIAACQNNINAIENCIAQCRQSSIDCIKDCEECIQLCQICAKACQNFIDKVSKI